MRRNALVQRAKKSAPFQVGSTFSTKFLSSRMISRFALRHRKDFAIASGSAFSFARYVSYAARHLRNAIKPQATSLVQLRRERKYPSSLPPQRG